MRLEEGKIEALAELGCRTAPERAEADDAAGALRFAGAVARMKTRRPGTRARLARAVALFGIAACAAAVVAFYGVRYRSRTAEVASTAAPSSALEVELDPRDGRASRTLDADGREWFATDLEGTAAIRMVSGARALLGPSSKAWCWSEAAPAWLHLELGQVDVSVPRLRMGQSLTVHTPNASVVVHGTAFTVQVVGTDAPSTTVAVREGTVEVREGAAATFVHAGEVWRSGMQTASLTRSSEAAPPVPEATPPALAPNASTGRAATPPRTSSSVPSSSAVASESSLARENALFREASQARQRGDLETSQATLGKLLTEFPKSPMRATALVERAFALSRLGRASDAAAVARQALSEGASEHVREQLWLIAFGEKPSR